MSRRTFATVGVFVLALGLAVAVSAQRGGGGSRGGGGGGTGGIQIPTRLTMLTAALKLDKTQTQAVKATIDETAKDAGVAAARTELTAAYAAIGTAIQSGASPDAIDGAVKVYGGVSQKMAALELAALAKVVTTLNDTQRANTGGITSAVAIMRGAFLDKKWDVTPGAKNY